MVLSWFFFRGGIRIQSGKKIDLLRGKEKHSLYSIHVHSMSTSLAADVDFDESRKFAKAAKTWWDPKSSVGLLHALNPARVKYISDMVAPQIRLPSSESEIGKPLQNMRILDVGCGGGLLSESLSRLGAIVDGLDPTMEATEAATRHASVDPMTAGVISYYSSTIYDLPPDRLYDMVCCFEVLEHVPDTERFVRTCAALTRPGGALVISTLNRTFKAWALAIMGAEYVGRVVPVGTHDWRKFRTPKQIRRFTHEAIQWVPPDSIVIQDVHGITYSPRKFRTVSSPLAWELCAGDTDVNFIMYGIKQRNLHTTLTGTTRK